jgi:PleD family two-component response regulator
LGETQLRPDDSIEQMLERADEALYLAKTAGRNCVKSV